MTWKEVLEITATILTITVSSIAICGVILAHKKGFLKAIHRLAEHHSRNIKEENRG